MNNYYWWDVLKYIYSSTLLPFTVYVWHHRNFEELEPNWSMAHCDIFFKPAFVPQENNYLLPLFKL